MGFRVFNIDSEDVTDNGTEWFIDKNGKLFMTDDETGNLWEAEQFGYRYSMN